MDTATGVPVTAVEIARAVREGRCTAVAVTRAHLGRIAARDPALNAFQAVLAEQALAAAAAVDADPRRGELPLAGVPVAIKDNVATVGAPLRYGSAATSDRLSAVDDPLVTRLRKAGAVVVGTTRMPELAIWGFTASRAFGATRNPVDPGRDPGGSTGGGAAAVAAGMAAIALGSDGGGSIRIPASYTGVVGIKTTTDLVPLPGGLAEHWFGLSVSGPLARTAADAAVALAVLADDPTIVAGSVPGRLRIARSLRSTLPIAPPDAHQRAAVDLAANLLRRNGNVVADASPAYPPTLAQLWITRWFAGIAADVDRLGLDPARLEPRTRAMVRRGRRVLRRGGPKPAGVDAWRAKAAAFFDEHDVLLCPVTARPPGPAGAFVDSSYVATVLAASRAQPFTQAWNLAGFPAVAVPVGSRDGLPLSVQLVGPPGADAMLLALAATVESG